MVAVGKGGRTYESFSLQSLSHTVQTEFHKGGGNYVELVASITGVVARSAAFELPSLANNERAILLSRTLP